jgi:hypothetical protein
MRKSRIAVAGIVLLSLSPLLASAQPRTCPCSDTVSTYPYTEDFEAGMGLWLNAEGDDFDWDRFQGPTPSDNTGPDVDHTLGTEEGYYMYTEASGDHSPEKTAILMGPCFDLTPLASPELAFWYHMAGDSMGSLYLEISDDDCASWRTAFERSGHQGYDWLLGVVDLSEYAGQKIAVRFRGVTGDGIESDMAIDDIVVGEAVPYPGGCCDTTTGDCLGYMTEAECEAYGEVSWHLMSDCTEDNFCPQPPPANDLCENATEILSVPFNDPEVDFGWATPDLPVSCDDEGAGDAEYGVWYTYTATEYCGARVTAETASGGWNVYIAVFTGPDCGDLTEIACNSGYDTDVTFDVEPGTTYWILTGGYWAGWQPDTTLSVTFNCSFGACCLGATCSDETVTSCASQDGLYLGDDVACTPDLCLYGACCDSNGCEMLTAEDCAAVDGDFKGNGVVCEPTTCPPVNETCATAIAITDGTPAVIGDNSLASLDDDAEASCQECSDRDLWYVYTATWTGTVAMDTEGSGQWDTVLSVWDECGGTEIACDDEGGTESLSALTFEGIAGETYYIRLASLWGMGGDFHINIACTEAPQAACCTGDGCTIDYRITCEAAGGLYAGDDSVCSGNDCNANGVEDTCDIASGTSEDCNGNWVLDECDLAAGTSTDLDGNGVPDECDPDCNGNGIIDGCDVSSDGGCASIPGSGQSADCQGDGIPDECQLVIPGCDGVRYDSGYADFVNGVRPDAGWWYVGIADDFTLDEDTEGTCLRFDIFDFADSGNLTTLHVRIYENPSGLMNLGSFFSATPVFDEEYSIDDGTLTITDTDEDFYSYDLLRFVASGPEYSLNAGDYAMHIMFPGTWDAGFWATAGSDDSDCAVYWGDWMEWPSDTCAGGDDLTRLSFALTGSFNNDVNGNGVPDDCEHAAGDLNCDGLINGYDIDPFVTALISAPDFEDYYAEYPDCDGMRADVNHDGYANGYDIDPFVLLLTGGERGPRP